VAVAGAFDAVLLLALPTLLVWAALGALWSPEVARPVSVPRALPAVALLAVALAAGAGVVRSTAQLVAIGMFAKDSGRASMERATRIDPGNYRVHLRLARSGSREQRCEHARAAHTLFPHAVAARDLSRRCGG
jgi:hypothetical protein